MASYNKRKFIPRYFTLAGFTFVHDRFYVKNYPYYYVFRSVLDPKDLKIELAILTGNKRRKTLSPNWFYMRPFYINKEHPLMERQFGTGSFDLTDFRGMGQLLQWLRTRSQPIKTTKNSILRKNFYSSARPKLKPFRKRRAYYTQQ